MNCTIRPETPADYTAVATVIEAAFRDLAISDHQEHFLVERLRESDTFIPGLSLVAEQDQQIVGHILLSPIKIVNEENTYPSLALAPVSVHPDFQNQGIGGQLIRMAHHRAKELGYSSIALIGHETYYPKFGYQRAEQFGIRFPFEVPPANAMVAELVPESLKGINGEIEYPVAFFS